MILALGASGRGFDSRSGLSLTQLCLVARVVNGTDLKSVGLCPRRFKSCTRRFFRKLKSFFKKLFSIYKLYSNKLRMNNQQLYNMCFTGLENNLYGFGTKRISLKFAGTICDKIPVTGFGYKTQDQKKYCLLYTSPSPRDRSSSRMPSSA